MWFPWASSSWVILLIYHRCTMERWNNLVFLSPSLSHCTLDFYLHSISSYFLRSSSFSCSFASSLAESTIHPCKMNTCCKSSRSFSISYFFWKMLPNTLLFQLFRCNLNFFRICWNLYMHVLWAISSCLHQDVESS
jgi:hypothetical protein